MSQSYSKASHRERETSEEWGTRENGGAMGYLGRHKAYEVPKTGFRDGGGASGVRLAGLCTGIDRYKSIGPSIPCAWRIEVGGRGLRHFRRCMWAQHTST